MELTELAKEATPPSSDEYPHDSDDLDLDEQALIDLQKSAYLLKTCKTLIDYLADPLLCRGVNKPLRNQMDKVSESIRQHLVEYEATYNEVEGDF